MVTVLINEYKEVCYHGYCIKIITKRYVTALINKYL